eukprot:13241762-Alexandrium_andersonii.AAC.1
MSASLVGSEMCIRDRRKVGSREHVTSSDRRGNGGAGGAAYSYCWRLQSACLLYTSDAADDM